MWLCSACSVVGWVVAWARRAKGLLCRLTHLPLCGCYHHHQQVACHGTYMMSKCWWVRYIKVGKEGWFYPVACYFSEPTPIIGVLGGSSWPVECYSSSSYNSLLLASGLYHNTLALGGIASNSQMSHQAPFSLTTLALYRDGFTFPLCLPVVPHQSY